MVQQTKATEYSS